MKIGVLALQGAFAEHEKVLEQLGAECIELRQARNLSEPYDALVLPGGESTVQGKLLKELGMFDTIKSQIENGMPVLATCAGMILLASDIAGQEDKAFGMNGIVITNPDCDIPAAMEHDLAGKYIPVRLKKSGVGGSLASLEQLGLLQRKIEALVADMGNALQNGQIGQRPVQMKAWLSPGQRLSL